MLIEEEIIFAERYQDLGRAIVELAIKDYIKYIKARNKNYNTPDAKAEIYAFGLQAKRFLESKESNYMSGIDYRINMRKVIDERYKNDGTTISNYYYREIQKRRTEQNEIIII